jgi:hypothetical protein
MRDEPATLEQAIARMVARQHGLLTARQLTTLDWRRAELANGPVPWPARS